MPPRVVVYTTRSCPYCIRAVRLLESKRIAFEQVDVTADTATRRWLAETTGRHTVPQVFINGTPIGGCDDLVDLDRSGQLDRLLAVEP
jgi:glutaredoxin 3